MSSQTSAPEPFFRFACIFEASLSLVALGIAWLASIDPFADLNYSEPALANGLIETLPVTLLFFALQALPYRPLQQIRQMLLETIGAKFNDRNWSDLLVLALIAGFSEELLFRGVLQPWLEQLTGMLGGLLLSNLLFALVHAVTPLYASLALLMGVYLGLSLDYGGSRNLLTPMVVHALYDFVAFVAILRQYRQTLFERT